MSATASVDALVTAAALCGQPPDLTSPVLSRLVAGFGITPGAIEVTVAADQRALQVDYRFAGMSVSDAVAMLRRVGLTLGEPEGALQRAEQIAAAEAIWVGVRFAESVAVYWFGVNATGRVERYAG